MVLAYFCTPCNLLATATNLLVPAYAIASTLLALAANSFQESGVLAYAAASTLLALAALLLVLA